MSDSGRGNRRGRTSRPGSRPSAGASSATVGLLVDELARRLRAASFAEPITEAREIIAGLYDTPRFWPVMNRDLRVGTEMFARAVAALDKRVRGAPLAYAVGRASFRHLTLVVDERVLIPRPETEQLVDLVLDELRGRIGGIAIDVGTGSGAIALSLATEGRFERICATDISLDALAVARENVGLVEPALRGSIEFRHGSLLDPVRDLRARVIVSNPPYIALGEVAALPVAVRDWEPPIALYGGADGLAVTTPIIRHAADLLESGGLLALEVDARRASLVAERFVLARKQERRRG